MMDAYYEDDHATIYHGDCREVLPRLPKVAAVVTSPPYAEQRSGQYASVLEADYPAFTVDWLERVPIDVDGSAIVNLRPHVSDGFVSPYWLRTRLALNENGWGECEELIWYKTNGGTGPFGSRHRPRRAWESLLWLSRTGSPWVDVKANGAPVKRTLVRGLQGKGVGDYISGIGDQVAGDPTRCEDVVCVPCGRWSNAGSEEHPAPFPVALAAYCVNLIAKPGGIVLDPFCGSGATLRAAKDRGRRSIGVDVEERYCEIAARRLGQEVLNFGAAS